MNVIFKLMALASVIAASSVFATPAPGNIPTPDSGATALLTAVAAGGVLVAKRILKK